jgi:hypothetical protein
VSFQTGTSSRASVAAVAEPAADARSSRGWVPELDHLRTLAILAVMAIHTTSGMNQVVPLNWVALVNLVLFFSVQFSVPLFSFFCSILIRALPGLGLDFSQALWYPLLFVGMLASSILVLSIVTPLPYSDLLFGVRPRSSPRT